METGARREAIPETDQAIEIPQGTKNYLKVSHTIYPNGTNDGQFERVNSYAMLYDIMVENASQCTVFSRQTQITM